jgi:hypothetical protein
MMLVAFIPFGAFFMTGMFRRKAAALTPVSSNTIFPDRP